MIPSFDDVLAAAERIKGVAVRTPLLRHDALDEISGGHVFVKAECLQRGGAFKIRGACNRIASLAPEERAPGVLAFSSGNHAIAVAIVARLFAIPAVIVMPSDAPRAKIDQTRAHGGEIVFYDRSSEDREAIGAKLASERGLAIVKPFDDRFIIAGQGTAGLEIGEEFTPEIALVPAGGGGLVTGTALALPNSQVFAVEPKGHDDLAQTLAAGEIMANAPGVRSICDSLLSPSIGRIPFAIAREKLAGARAVSDASVLKAMRFAFERLKIVIEPGGAVGLAAALDGAVDLKGKSAAVIVSGGNVDAEMFQRALA